MKISEEREAQAASNRRTLPIAAGLFLAGKLFVDSQGIALPEVDTPFKGPPGLADAQAAKAASKKAFIDGDNARRAALAEKEKARQAAVFPSAK